jgi:trimethylamine--corrinoid protein Co-methyltransferase
LRLSQLRVLSENELSQIHEAAMDVLWNTGMSIASREAPGLLTQGGATVDYEKKIAKIPEHLVKGAEVCSTPVGGHAVR